MKKLLKGFIGIVLVLVLVGFVGSIFGDDDTKDNPPKDNEVVDSGEKDKEKELTAEVKSFEAELSAGHYLFGVDLPYGKFTLTAVSGSGNVISSNMFSGGLNEIMGTEDDGMSVKVFKNANLDKDVVLSVGGNLILKIESEKATFELEQRIPTGKEITLSSGNYVAGSDLEPGVYVVTAVSGGGNVSSDNMFEGGINEIMGVDNDDFYIREFKNVVLEEGTVLTISGVEVKLTPSK